MVRSVWPCVARNLTKTAKTLFRSEIFVVFCQLFILLWFNFVIKHCMLHRTCHVYLDFRTAYVSKTITHMSYSQQYLKCIQNDSQSRIVAICPRLLASESKTVFPQIFYMLSTNKIWCFFGPRISRNTFCEDLEQAQSLHFSVSLGVLWPERARKNCYCL